MQTQNTLADTMPPEEIHALRHPMPHPRPDMTVERLTIDLAEIERKAKALRDDASHIMGSTFDKPMREPRAVHIARKPHDRIGVALLLAGSFLGGYAFGLALVGLSNLQWGVA